jgi:Spy/CpxP family protein refolding chaperone
MVMVPLLAAPASLEAFGGPPGGHRWWSDPDIQQKAGLSPEQTEQIKALYASQRPRMIDLRADLRKRQLELEQLLEASTVDKAALSQKIDEVAAARARLDKERLTTLAAVRSVLSAEQYGKLRSMQRDFRGRRGHGMVRRGGGPCLQGEGLPGPGR